MCRSRILGEIPSINETKEMVDDTALSVFISHIMLYIMIVFLIMCLLFGFSLGHHFGASLGENINTIAEEQNAKKIQIIDIRRKNYGKNDYINSWNK